MKVVHICLACFYPDGYSYQENMLPKFHKLLGYDVEVIASLFTFDENGKGTYYPKADTYQNEYDITVHRLDYRKPDKIYRTLRRYVDFKRTLEDINPDIIFVHGCQFLDIDIVCNYAERHRNVKVYVDNHADFSNSARNLLSRNIMHKIIWRHCAHKILPYTEKFYGVLPARVDFLKDIYKLPSDKCELLVMGADDDAVEKARSTAAGEKIRRQYGIDDDDFLIVTGGKIDLFKTQTLLLMQAVNAMKSNVKLIVFGSVVNELKEQVSALCNGTKVQYVGWVESKDSYDYFEAADLVVFPGRHSVFWEQVTGQGKPMVVKDWPGTHHVDLGGNVKFLHDDSAEEIQQVLENIVGDEVEYRHMLNIAETEGMKHFSYKEIARKCIR